MQKLLQGDCKSSISLQMGSGAVVLYLRVETSTRAINLLILTNRLQGLPLQHFDDLGVPVHSAAQLFGHPARELHGTLPIRGCTRGWDPGFRPFREWFVV